MDAPEKTPAEPSASRAPRLALIAVVLATALTALFWIDVRNRIGGTQEEIARRLQDIDSGSREARAVARQTQEALREAQTRITQLESRLAESQSQQLALEALYQD